MGSEDAARAAASTRSSRHMSADRWVIASAHGYYVGPRARWDRTPRWSAAPSTLWRYLSQGAAERTIEGIGVEARAVLFASVPPASYRVEALDLPNGRMRWEFVKPDGSEPLCVDHDHGDAYTLRHCERAAMRAEVIMLFGALEEAIITSAKRRRSSFCAQ